jgi:RNA polymerase sigma-70 factor (ECF subfamily)
MIQAAMSDPHPLVSSAMRPGEPVGTVEALTRLAQGADAPAWAWLVENHGARMRAAAQAVTGDPALADDAVQEALLLVRRHAGRFRDRGEAAAAGWVARAACLCALHLSRERRRRAERERRHGMPQPSAAEPADPETVAAVRRELAELPPRHREPLALHFLAGLDYEGLARQLGTSVNAARVRVHRALVRLRERLARAGVAAPTPERASGLLSALLAGSAAPDPTRFVAWKGLLSSPAHATIPAGTGLGGAAIGAKALLGAVAFVSLTVAVAGYAVTHRSSRPVAPVAAAANPPAPTGEDPVETERQRDLAAYRDEYLPKKHGLENETLEKSPTMERWVAIAGGHVLQAQAPAAGIAIFADAAAADRAADAAAPRARHRFLFRVGQDGDVTYVLGGTGRRYVLGTGFTSEFQIQGFTQDAMTFQRTATDPPMSAGWTAGSHGWFLDVHCQDPGAGVDVSESFQVSTGFNGGIVAPPSLADDLRLARWEVPGEAHVQGMLQTDEHARRAQLRLEIAELGYSRVIDAAIWSSEGREGRMIEGPALAHGGEIPKPERIAEERRRDAAAYHDEYLPRKSWIEGNDRVRGKWVAIAGGAVVRDGEPGISLLESASAASDAADREHPGSAHRYIFQIGSDGDLKQFVGGASGRYVLGTASMDQVPGLVDFAGVGAFADDAQGVRKRIAAESGRGPNALLHCASADGGLATDEIFQLSSGYDGTTLVPPSIADDLRLERWEIPGSVQITGIYHTGECRRALMRFSLAEIGYSREVPVVITAAEGRNGREVSPVVPPPKPKPEF